PEDTVVVQTSTLTDANGDYQLFLKPGDYNVVATAPGFAATAVNLAALPGQTPTQDFVLTVAPSGTLAGTVTITGADAETFANLSIRQDLTVAGLPEVVEVDSVDVLNGAGYSTELSAGDYDVLASTCGFPSQQTAVSVSAGATNTLDVNF
ncbi:carboxypeptidase regulatory-like domain-containing protein, partial [bacterium]